MKIILERHVNSENVVYYSEFFVCVKNISGGSVAIDVIYGCHFLSIS